MFSPLSTSGRFAYIFHIKKFIFRAKWNYFHACTFSGTAAEANLSNSLSVPLPCPTSFQLVVPTASIVLERLYGQPFGEPD